MNAALRLALAAALLALSPGLPAWAAAARGVGGAPKPSGHGARPAGTWRPTLAPALTSPAALPSLPALPTLPALPSSSQLPQASAVQSPAAAAPLAAQAALQALGAQAQGFEKLSGPALKSEAASVFESLRPRAGAFDAVFEAPSGPSDAGLSAAAPGEAGARATPPTPPAGAEQPRQRLSRSIRIGALSAIAVYAADLLIMGGAMLLGHEFRPSYQMPALSDPATYSALGSWLAPVAAKLQDLFVVAVMAPFNEEVYFRAGVIGLAGLGAVRLMRGAQRLLERASPKLASLRGWVLPAAFGVAATEAALFFALLHEMSDPVLITVRVGQALLLSYLYVREGLSSALVHHAVFNGIAILTLPLISAAGGALLLPQTFAVMVVLASAGLALWLWTRPAARAEAREIRAKRLAPYRLSARASANLGRFGWASVAVLGLLAALQSGAAQTMLLLGMALQVAPAALAFQAYGFLLKNHERRKGASAVAALRNPAEPLPMGNAVGWQTGAVFLGIYLGVIGGMLLMRGVGSTLGWGLAASPALALVPLLAVAGIGVYRLIAGSRGIPFWLYAAQFAAGSAALSLTLMEWLLRALVQFAERAAEAGIAGAAQGFSWSALAWTIPAFAALAALMTVLGRRLSRP